MARKRGVQMMDHGEVLGVVQTLAVADDALLAQHLFGVLHAVLGEMHLLLLLVDVVIARHRRLVRLAVLGLARELGHDAVDAEYNCGESSDGPEMISGVRASSIRIESTSSTMA